MRLILPPKMEPLRPKQIHPNVIISCFGAEPVWNSLAEMPSGSNTAENQTMLSSIVKTVLHCTPLVPVAGTGLYQNEYFGPIRNVHKTMGPLFSANVSPDLHIGISLSKARGQVTGLWV